jgi:hypothetical protein
MLACMHPSWLLMQRFKIGLVMTFLVESVAMNTHIKVEE